MQHAWARNGHFWLGVTADAFQIAEIVQHRVLAKAQLAGDAHAVGFGLHAVKLDALLGIVTLNALKTVEEVEVPPGTAKLTVGHHMQAARTLLLDDVANGLVLHRAKLPGINLTAGKFQASLLDGIRA